MRFSLFSMLALGGLALANPTIAKRDDALTLLQDLYSTVRIYTGSINSTLAPLTNLSSTTDKADATAAVGAQIKLITSAIVNATQEIRALVPSLTNPSVSIPGVSLPIISVKRSVYDAEDAALEVRSAPKEKRQLLAIGAILALIIIEIFATVAVAVGVLGLAGLLLFVSPLAGSLAILVLTVELLLDAVLAAVIVLLDTLLTGLAVGLLAL